MTPQEIRKRIEVLLAAMKALLGEVPPSLRGVTADWNEHAITIRCYFDGEISEEDRESMECVLTEVIADFPDDEQIELECVRQDAPAPLEGLRDWVYLRREPMAEAR